MKGIKNIFLREAKAAGVAIEIGKYFRCDIQAKKIIVPVQDCDLHLFFGFHELGHYILHRNETIRNYDNLYQRIQIEIEADDWANKKMREYGFDIQMNNCTMGLIALWLLQGNKLRQFTVEREDLFVVLYCRGIEVYANFESNLPMHPVIY